MCLPQGYFSEFFSFKKSKLKTSVFWNFYRLSRMAPQVCFKNHNLKKIIFCFNLFFVHLNRYKTALKFILFVWMYMKRLIYLNTKKIQIQKPWFKKLISFKNQDCRRSFYSLLIILAYIFKKGLKMKFCQRCKQCYSRNY